MVNLQYVRDKLHEYAIKENLEVLNVVVTRSTNGVFQADCEIVPYSKQADHLVFSLVQLVLREPRLTQFIDKQVHK